MPAALSTGRTAASEQQFAERFRREIAPHRERLESLRQRQRRRFMRNIVLGAALVLGAILLLAPIGAGWAVLSGGLAALVGLVLVWSAQARYLYEVRQTVVPALCQAIGDLRHAVGDAPDLDLELLQGLGLLPVHQGRLIDDVFEGRHRGVGFTMAQVRLRHRHRGYKRGGRRVFRGLVFAIEAPDDIPARILIVRKAGALDTWRRRWREAFRTLQRVPVPHSGFEARFELHADDPAQARLVVTPDLCQALIALDDAHDDEPIQAAFSARRCYLALPMKRDVFRPGSLFRSLDALEPEARRVRHHVELAHRAIDQLHDQRRQAGRRRA